MTTLYRHGGTSGIREWPIKKEPNRRLMLGLDGPGGNLGGTLQKRLDVNAVFLATNECGRRPQTLAMASNGDPRKGWDDDEVEGSELVLVID